LRDKLHRHYAYTHKEDYEKTIQEFMKMIEGKEPNSAHYAMAQSPFQQVPIITQNVDGLHQLAGSENVIELHGRLPDTIVLYGDSAPMYQVAIDCVKDLKYNDSYFVIVGTSFTTTIASDLLKIAKQKKAKVFVINDNAGERVPKILSNIRHELGW
jgi:NAD-dependent deacetylase